MGKVTTERVSKSKKAKTTERVSKAKKAKTTERVSKAKKAKMHTVRKLSRNGRESFTFFFTTESPFSQFHPCTFVVDDITYNCAEQYMMHQKAVLFNDLKMAEQILKEQKPGKIKACGRKVKGFIDHVWTIKCQDVVKKGNLAKFSQNDRLKHELFMTAKSTLVEASPRDCRWGIGLGKDNDKALSRDTWRGKNWLGNILTEVREELMKAEDSGKADGSSGAANALHS